MLVLFYQQERETGATMLTKNEVYTLGSEIYIVAEGWCERYGCSMEAAIEVIRDSMIRLGQSGPQLDEAVSIAHKLAGSK